MEGNEWTARPIATEIESNRSDWKSYATLEDRFRILSPDFASHFFTRPFLHLLPSPTSLLCPLNPPMGRLEKFLRFLNPSSRGIKRPIAPRVPTDGVPEANGTQTSAIDTPRSDPSAPHTDHLDWVD